MYHDHSNFPVGGRGQSESWMSSSKEDKIFADKSNIRTVWTKMSPDIICKQISKQFQQKSTNMSPDLIFANKHQKSFKQTCHQIMIFANKHQKSFNKKQ